jgi:microcystin-dependent protein
MNPVLGTVLLFAGDYAPVGWLACDGALLPVWENVPLFQAIGNAYGGDGRTTFALPNLPSPLEAGGLYIIAAAGSQALAQVEEGYS